MAAANAGTDEAKMARRALGSMALTVEVATTMVVEQRTGRPGEPQPGDERGRPNAVEAAGRASVERACCRVQTKPLSG